MTEDLTKKKIIFGKGRMFPIKPGTTFKIRHSFLSDDKIYTVKSLRDSETGIVIEYEDGEIHASLCEFLTQLPLVEFTTEKKK